MPTASSSNTDGQSTEFTETIKIALYSKYGGRKTLQIGHLIEMEGADNVLVVSAESGLNTVKSFIRDDRVIRVTSLDEMRKAWGEASKFAADAAKNKWVCIDGMSEVTNWIANEQLSGADRYYEASQLNRTQDPKDLMYGKYLSRGEINTMAIYGRVGRDSENLLSAWIRLPVNLYCNYLEDMTGRSGFEASLPWGPDVPGKVGLKAVMSKFDFVGRLFYDKDGRLVGGFDATSNVYMARTREDRAVVELPKVIPDFRLDNFVRMIRGEEVADAKAG